ncbi:MAG: phosphoribosylformylglycinamidine synthase subunit PurL [Candidatus Calescibacterium sp.]|nr:phosphoribosylformylglycinamidine synthase subunit PurL [Candidatus Calescibacterium sp.]
MLTKSEIEIIKNFLQRDPSDIELSIFDALWSEHASYKSSKIHLQKLPTKSERVVFGPGENAGIIRLSDGTYVAFKIESHNHPSYIEPYSGAATGVGGIVRDVLCVGSRPVALADFLCFGELSGRMKYLCERVVDGISDYGNSIGVPIIRGQTLFYKFFNHNILVNAMCVGVVPEGIRPVSSKPQRKGVIIYCGAKTGADGIGGSVMASEAFEQQDQKKKRPSVQIGDPFAEKCLIEAVLETLEKVGVIAMQDMGAAGLLNSTTEVAAKGGFGAKIDISRIPKRQNLKPVEFLLSESQERMLIVADSENFPKIKDIFSKWGLECEIIGELTDTGNYEVFDGAQKVLSVPLKFLIDNAPKYDRPKRRPVWSDSLRDIALEKLPIPPDPSETFIKMISSPLLASKEFIYEQYDSTVLGQTYYIPGADAGVLRLNSLEKFDEYGKQKDIGLAISLDGNPLYCFTDPYVGTMLVVLEGCRNLACVGAEPLAITDNLNFGNPENEEVMWEFALSVDGMKKALEELGIPVVSGNVSFYNETDGVSIPPTPVVGTIGEIFPFSEPQKPYFEPGRFVIAIGDIYPMISASAYLYVNFEKVGGKIPEPNFELEKKLMNFVRFINKNKIVSSCHDVSDGGLVLALFESAVFGKFSGKDLCGLKVSKNFIKDRWDFYIFSEAFPLYIVSIEKNKLQDFLSLCSKNSITFQVIGETVDDDIFEVEGLFSFKISELFNLWRKSLRNSLGA